MKKLPFLLLLFLIPLTLVQAQDRMTPELLWKLGRVSALGVTENGQTLIYTASFPDVKNNTSTRKYYSVSVDGGESKVLDSIEGLLPDAKMSADGTLKVSHKSVKLEKVTGKELYP